MDKRKKGLFLIQLPPPVHGVSVINQWIIESKIINENFKIDAINLATARTIADIGKQGLYKYIKLLSIYSKVLFRLLINKYNFIYITLSPTGSAFVKDSFLILLGRLFSLKVIIHLHGKGINKYLQNSNKIILKFYNWVFKNSYVIHLSNSLMKDIELISSYKKQFVVPNGIPIKISDVKKNNKEVSILHLSNLIESKGGLTLLKAVNVLLTEKTSNFHLNVVGAWGDEDYKIRFQSYLKNNNLESVVSVHGALFGKEKHEILSSSHIFVLPTYYPNECFPLTILEALQAGLPVISSFEGAIPEIIEEAINGFLVDSQNEIELANKIKLLIESETLRKSMGQKARESYQTKFAFSIFENNLLNVFKEVLN